MSNPNKIAVSAIIESDIPGMDGILLINDVNHPGLWDIPGGTLKKRETIAECGIREVHEESGLTVVPDFLVGIYQCPRTPAGNNLTRFVLGCSVAQGHSLDEFRPSPKTPELGFFTEEQIEIFDLNGRLRNNGISRAIIDYRKGIRHDLSVITYLDKAPKKKGQKQKTS